LLYILVFNRQFASRRSKVMIVEMLKVDLESRGIKPKGKKADLVALLETSDKERAEASNPVSRSEREAAPAAATTPVPVLQISVVLCRSVFAALDGALAVDLRISRGILGTQRWIRLVLITAITAI
jgi:hypothetical protein